MARRRLTRAQLLAQIRASADRQTAQLAERLIRHADHLGLATVGRHESVSLRFPLLPRTADSWLTLLVISSAGTVFVNWLGRWSRLPGGDALSADYERNLRQLLATDKVVFHPAAFRRAIPLRS